MRILVVEDEDSIRSALARAFTRDGHEVRCAADLAEARTLLSGWRPEVSVSDLKLPDGSGLDLVGSLGVPFVMISGYATYDDAVRALRCGAVDFFTKPVAIKDVRAAIARVRPAGAGVAWADAVAGLGVLPGLLAGIPGPLARLAVAELVQAAPTGRLAVQVDGRGLRCWLDGLVDWAAQPDRRQWLEAHGVRLVCGAEATCAIVDAEPALAYDSASELLWSEELVLGRAVQAAAWRSVGSWLLAAVRAGSGPFAGLSQALAERCQTCGVSVRTVPGTLAQPGVGGAERAGLLADDVIGSPVA